MGTKANITTEFSEDGFAVIRMLSGQNRLNLNFLASLNDALDTVLRCSQKSFRLGGIGIPQHINHMLVPRHELWNKSCKALITTSEGKFYSNGIDLDWLFKQPNETIQKFRTELADTLWRIMHFPMPTVAAINGHAFAGGAFLAMAHDYRVMRSDRGWICWNETHLKMQLGEPLMEVLNTKVWNLDAKREAVVFGRRITAPEAKTLALVDSVVNTENLLQEAKRLARHALGNNVIDRNALELMKKDIYVRKIFPSKM